MKFNSQICTTREQSERLLSLGLKKETADMYIWIDNRASEARNTSDNPQNYFLEFYREHLIRNGSIFIPAWSLHMLIEMIQDVCPQVVIIFHKVDIRSNVKRIAYSFDVCDNLYDNIVDCIEWLINEGYFNKEYLVDQDTIEEHCKGVLEYLDYIRGEEE